MIARSATTSSDRRHLFKPKQPERSETGEQDQNACGQDAKRDQDEGLSHGDAEENGGDRAGPGAGPRKGDRDKQDQSDGSEPLHESPFAARTREDRVKETLRRSPAPNNPFRAPEPKEEKRDNEEVAGDGESECSGRGKTPRQRVGQPSAKLGNRRGGETEGNQVLDRRHAASVAGRRPPWHLGTSLLRRKRQGQRDSACGRHCEPATELGNRL